MGRGRAYTGKECRQLLTAWDSGSHSTFRDCARALKGMELFEDKAVEDVADKLGRLVQERTAATAKPEAVQAASIDKSVLDMLRDIAATLAAVIERIEATKQISMEEVQCSD